MTRPWKISASEIIFRSKIFNLRRDDGVSPLTGDSHDLYVLEAPPWVNIIPLTVDDRVVLIKQYRHGCREVHLEIPGGMVDPEDSGPAEAAARELKEETGYEADHVSLLGSVTPNPAIQNNTCHTYLAWPARRTCEPTPDRTEEIEAVEVPIIDVPTLIAEGRITHSLVVVAFFWYSLTQAGLRDSSRLGPLPADLELPPLAPRD